MEYGEFMYQMLDGAVTKTNPVLDGPKSRYPYI